MDVYEKINKAITVCSFIHTLRHKRGSLERPMSGGAHTDTPNEREEGDEIPISFHYSSQPQPLESAQKNTQIIKVVSKIEPEAPAESPGHVAKSYSKVGSHQFTIQEGKKIHIENSFTTYIDRVRARMRTISNAGGLSNVDNVSHVNNGSRRDEFSEYIDRAGVKIRTTSSIGGGDYAASSMESKKL